MEKGEVILYQPNETIKLEVKLDQETVWLSIDEMAILFERDKSVIGKHIRNIFKEEELFKESVWAKFVEALVSAPILFISLKNVPAGILELPLNRLCSIK